MATAAKPNALQILDAWTAPAMPTNAPGIVPQVYPGSTGSGSNQNVSVNNYGGYTPGQSFSGGQSMPAYGTPVYNTLVSGGSSVSSSTPSYSAMTAPVQVPKTISRDTLGSVQAPIVLGTPTSSPTTLSSTPGSAIQGSVANGSDPTGMFAPITATPEVSPADKTLTQYRDEILGITRPPSSIAEDEAKARQQSGIDAALAQKNNTQSAINGITAQMNVDLSNQRKAISDAGGTYTGFGGVEAEISRLATIKLLPLQAQLATDSGNYQAAEASYDRLFSIYSADSKAQTDYYNQAGMAAYDLMTKAEQRKYEEKLAEKKSLDAQTQDTIAWQRRLVDSASSAGDSRTATSIANVRPPTALPGTSLYTQQVTQYNADLLRLAGTVKAKPNTQIVEVGGRKLLIDSMGNTVKDLGMTSSGGSTTPTIKSINGTDMQWNPTTGKWETPTTTTSDSGLSSKTMPLAQAQANVESITSLVSDPTIRTAVGPTWLGRFVGRGLDTLTGARQNFIGSVEQIRSNLNLEALIGAKARGATFGALSDQELQVLASSASKIGSWAMKDKNGNVTGYNASEKDFKKELDKINNFAKLDFIIKGGDPIDVNAQMQSDGSIWTNNSDGTFTQIK